MQSVKVLLATATSIAVLAGPATAETLRWADAVGVSAYSVMGAAKAMSVGDTVLVGDDTWRLTRSTVDYERLGTVEVKGKAEPIATYQVIAAGTAEDDAGTPFVGRASELVRLREAFDASVAGRRGRLAALQQRDIARNLLVGERPLEGRVPREERHVDERQNDPRPFHPRSPRPHSGPARVTPRDS